MNNKDGSVQKSFKGWEVSPLVDAAVCIANRNKKTDGSRMYDTYEKFGGGNCALGRDVRDALRKKGLSEEEL